MVTITLNTELSSTEKSGIQDLIDTFDNYSFAVDELINQTSSTLLSDSAYAANNTAFYDALFDFLSLSEGLRSYRYPDSAGFISIGIGFNMDQWGTEASDRNTYLRPILEAINVNDWEDVYDGNESISSAQAKELFHITMTGRDASGDVVSSWGDVIAVKLQNQLELSISSSEVIDGQELAALFSLAFNNPTLIGPNLRDAVEDDSIAAAVTEILEHSNRLYDDYDVAIAGTHGLANRRLVEAAVYKGDVDLTLPDAEFWQLVHAAQDRVAAGLSPNSTASIDPSTQLVINVQGALPPSASITSDVLTSPTTTKIVSLADATNFIEIATSSSDTIYASIGDSSIYGRGGNDTLVGSSGNDSFDGGEGNDWLDYSALEQGVDVDLYAGNTILMSGGPIKDVFTGIEHVMGSMSGDVLFGDEQDNYLKGLNGADSLDGDIGSDTLEGGAGNDTLEGGSGSDSYVYDSDFGEGLDIINDSGATDLLILDGVAIDENTSGVTFTAMDETTLALTFGPNNYTTIILNDFVSGDYGIDFTMPDEYYVDPGDPLQVAPPSPGVPGNAQFYAGSAASEILAAWAERILGGGGNDYISNANSYHPLAVDIVNSDGSVNHHAYPDFYAENVYLDGGSGNDYILLNYRAGGQYSWHEVVQHYDSYDDYYFYETVIHYVGAETSYGHVIGGLGNDTILADTGFIDATIDGGEGDDYIEGGYHIYGGDGSDTIYGAYVYSYHHDMDVPSSINGGNGDDWLFVGYVAPNISLGHFDGGDGYDVLSSDFWLFSNINFNLSTSTASHAAGQIKSHKG